MSTELYFSGISISQVLDMCQNTMQCKLNVVTCSINGQPCALDIFGREGRIKLLSYGERGKIKFGISPRHLE